MAKITLNKALQIALTALVESHVRATLSPKGQKDPDAVIDKANDIIEAIAYEASDDHGMDIAEAAAEKFPKGTSDEIANYQTKSVRLIGGKKNEIDG